MIQATQLDGTWCCALDSIWGSRSTAPGQGKVATCGRASSLCTEEQASRQCQQDSSRLAKGVRETTKGLRRQRAAGELTTPQCPVLMHLVRVAPTTRLQDRRIIRDGDGDAVKASAKTSWEKASSFSIRLKTWTPLLVDPAGSWATRPRPPASRDSILDELFERLGTLHCDHLSS